MSDSLAIFSKAAIMLAEADTIQKTKELKSLALTAADWARRRGMGKEAVAHATSYALEAERKMGEMLLATERAKGTQGQLKGRSSGGCTMLPPDNQPPTLAALGLTKRESCEAQLLASIPQETFEAVKTGRKTRSAVKRDKRRSEQRKRIQSAQKAPKNQGPYDIILADPPWRYEHCEAPNREIENQYPTATLEEIFGHIPQAANDAILFLWATAPKLAESLRVMEAWGFSYRSCAVWDKMQIGMGYWWRIQHELLLVGVKGKPGCTPECARVSSIFSEARTKHSAKPMCIYQWIESAFPDRNKLEMYARSVRDGWTAWGNEL